MIGKRWKHASAEQRERLVSELRLMMYRTYSTAIETLADSSINYGASKRSRSGNIAMVPTTVKRPSGPGVSMKFYLFRSDAGWRLYDIAVAGVSMLRTYKNTFKSHIKRVGLDGLIEHLVAANSANSAA